MEDWQLFSLPQILGYGAMLFGVGAFLSHQDRRFKRLMVVQAIFYGGHFLLLQNYTALAGALISLVRAIISQYSRSWAWVVIFFALAAISAVFLITSLAASLPLVASLLGTIAFFRLSGLAMRLVFLVGSLLWLINNVISGSIGGTLLEIFNIAANGVNILRLVLAKHAKDAKPIEAAP